LSPYEKGEEEGGLAQKRRYGRQRRLQEKPRPRKKEQASVANEKRRNERAPLSGALLATTAAALYLVMLACWAPLAAALFCI